MSTTLHNLIVYGEVPPFENGETVQSYARRVYRSGVLDGVSWGVAQVAPIPAYIQPAPVGEEDLSESEIFDEAPPSEGEGQTTEELADNGED